MKKLRIYETWRNKSTKKNGIIDFRCGNSTANLKSQESLEVYVGHLEKLRYKNLCFDVDWRSFWLVYLSIVEKEILQNVRCFEPVYVWFKALKNSQIYFVV